MNRAYQTELTNRVYQAPNAGLRLRYGSESAGGYGQRRSSQGTRCNTGLAAYTLGQAFVHQRKTDFVVEGVQQVLKRLDLAEDVQCARKEVNGDTQIALLSMRRTADKDAPMRSGIGTGVSGINAPYGTLKFPLCPQEISYV